ncbi:LysR family transcriptional regulator [Pseudooceanicola sp. CBS1P-1]|nr:MULTISPECIES: LysR family transcriptional regulator [Pseudooceanicola]MBT9383533.1 LysR family transcriptional regulator [Pseudooceanicola endophyticus]
MHSMKLAQSDLRALAVFRAVVAHRGFAGAQEALGLSQSAVSFHLKALEDRLGFRLCQRGRGGFALTERGVEVHARSDALFDALALFEDHVGGLRRQITGTLRLGLVDNTLSDPGWPLPEVLDRIARRAPQARVEIRIDSPDRLLGDLQARTLDLALLPDPGPRPGLCLSPLRDEAHLLYCARAHPLFASARITEAEIARHPFVTRPYAGPHELSRFPGARSGAEASNIEAQAMFILSGRYLGYLPTHYAEAHLRAGRLRALLPGQAALATLFVQATRDPAPASALLGLFSAELAGALAAPA